MSTLITTLILLDVSGTNAILQVHIFGTFSRLAFGQIIRILLRVKAVTRAWLQDRRGTPPCFRQSFSARQSATFVFLPPYLTDPKRRCKELGSQLQILKIS